MLFLAACTESASTPSANTTQSSEQRAEQLYKIKCGICHGADGKLMVGGAPDITQTQLTEAEVNALITYGKGTMPAQKDVLSSAEIQTVAAYVIANLKQKD